MTWAVPLANYPAELVRIARRKCDRRGRKWRATLIALYGERAPLPDELAQLASDCPKRGAIGNEACSAYFAELVERARARSTRRAPSHLEAS